MTNKPPDSQDPSEVPSVQRLQGTTPEQAQRVGTLLFHPHRLQIRNAGAARFEMDTTSSKVGPFTIGTLRYNTPVVVDTPPYESAYHVNVALHGALRTVAGSEQLVINPVRAAVYRPDVKTAFSGWESPCSMLAIKIEREVFEQVVASFLGLEHRPFIDFALPLRIDTGPGAAWYESVKRLFRLAQEPWTQPLVTDVLIEEAIIGLLRAGDHSFQELLSSVPPAPSSSLQRAIELIESVPEEALTLESIAYVAGVSGRALQLSFRKELGVTPMQYLKNVRLERAAQLLRAAGPTGPAVADVARSLGFTHMGRFSADYAARYGELPSATRLG